MSTAVTTTSLLDCGDDVRSTSMGPRGVPVLARPHPEMGARRTTSQTAGLRRTDEADNGTDGSFLAFDARVRVLFAYESGYKREARRQ